MTQIECKRPSVPLPLLLGATRPAGMESGSLHLSGLHDLHPIENALAGLPQPLLRGERGWCRHRQLDKFGYEHRVQHYDHPFDRL